MIATTMESAAPALLAWGIFGIALRLCIRQVLHAIQRRRQEEFERQLLELLALATRRGKAILPVLERTALDHQSSHSSIRSHLARVKEQLTAGSTLSDALCATSLADSKKPTQPALNPARTAAIRSAEGRGSLPATLHELAHEQRMESELAFRARLSAVYPALVGIACLLFTAFHSMFPTIQPNSNITFESRDGLPLTYLMCSILVAIGGLALLSSATRNRLSHLWQHLWCRLPIVADKLRLLAAARALRTVSNRVQDGDSLGRALAHGSLVAGHPALATSLDAASRLADSGALPEEIWTRAMLPEFVHHRLVLLQSSASSQLATQLRALSSRCTDVAVERFERARQRFQTAAVLALGIAIAFQMHETFERLNDIRQFASTRAGW